MGRSDWHCYARNHRGLKRFALADMETPIIAGVRRRLFAAIERYRGRRVCDCPVCGQNVEARRVSTRDFAALCRVAVTIADERGIFNWHTLQEACLENGYQVQPGYAGAKDLGLISAFYEDGAQVLEGWWRLTSAGRAVGENRAVTGIPRCVYVFDNQVVGRSEEDWSPDH